MRNRGDELVLGHVGRGELGVLIVDPAHLTHCEKPEQSDSRETKARGRHLTLERGALRRVGASCSLQVPRAGHHPSG